MSQFLFKVKAEDITFYNINFIDHIKKTRTFIYDLEHLSPLIAHKDDNFNTNRAISSILKHISLLI